VVRLCCCSQCRQHRIVSMQELQGFHHTLHKASGGVQVRINVIGSGMISIKPSWRAHDPTTPCFNSHACVLLPRTDHCPHLQRVWEVLPAVLGAHSLLQEHFLLSSTGFARSVVPAAAAAWFRCTYSMIKLGTACRASRRQLWI
jgi:hypothetical protein